jgi:tetratricopeptide (TPR) repeat protein
MRSMTHRHYRINLLFTGAVYHLGLLGMLWAQGGQGGTESNLNYGFGARAMGLGNAFTAMADDPTAVYWNPAGLEYIDQQSATLFHTSLWEGISYDFAGYVLPTLSQGTFGAGLGRIGVGEIEETGPEGVKLGKFSQQEMHFFFAYAKKMPYNITPGITLRLVQRSWTNLSSLGNLVETGIGLDMGMMYRPEWLGSPWLQDWSVGLNVQNILPPQLQEGTGIDVFPMAYRLGFFKKLRLVGGEAANFVFDFDYSTHRDLRLHFGTEYSIHEMGSLRLGYGAGGFTLGASIEYSPLQFEYAYGTNEYSEVLAPVHRLSLTIHFGATRNELFNRAQQELVEDQARVLIELQEAEKENFITDHLHTGNNYMTEQKYLDAIVEYQQVLNRDSLHVQARDMLDSANTLLQGHFDDMQSLAIKSALDEERLNSDRQFIEQHFEKGRILLDQNRFSDALAEFEQAFALDTTNTTVGNAIRTTRRRIDEEVINLLNRSRQELKNQNHGESLVLLNTARDLHSDNQQLNQEINALTWQVNIQKNLQRGILLYQIKEFDKALVILQEVLRLDPQNTMARDYAEKCKIETIGKVIKMDAESEQQYLQGMNEFLEGDYQQAIGIWENILLNHPYNKKVLTAIQGARERMKVNGK